MSKNYRVIVYPFGFESKTAYKELKEYLFNTQMEVAEFLNTVTEGDIEVEIKSLHGYAFLAEVVGAKPKFSDFWKITQTLKASMLRYAKKKGFEAVGYISTGYYGYYILDILYGIDDKLRVLDAYSGKITVHKIKYELPKDEEADAQPYVNIRGCKYYGYEWVRLK